MMDIEYDTENEEPRYKSEEELCSQIDQEVQAALGEYTDKLSKQRADAMRYYLGEPYGDEKPDRSSIVTREVMDTIEWIKPELMKLFSSGGDTVRFEPQGPDDVDQAAQETDYINYLLHRRNPGFRLIYEWITDGLLQKVGVVKVFYDTNRSKVREEYKGLTQTELMALASRDDIEVVEHEAYVLPETKQAHQAQMAQLQQAAAANPMAAQQLAAMGQQALPQHHDVAVLRTGGQSGVTIENVPPEEFLISRQAKCVQSSPFCAHRRLVTLSELREMGYTDLDDLPFGHDEGVYDEERLARHEYDDTDPYEPGFPTSTDESMRQVWATEAYIRCDYDGDGVAELRKVFKVGRRILENEEVDCMPFAAWTPIIVSHKFHGLSLADIVMDLQRLSSQLFRNNLDNQYLANNGRYVAVEGMVNLDDLMTSRPHGVVRAKMPQAVQRLDTPQLGNTAFQMLAYVDQLRERRTGVSERTQGLDPEQLNSNTAASAVNQVMTAAQQRIELIARVFAETGLTDLFRLMHKLVLQNQTSKDIFRLRDKYVEVDPSEWRERMDTAVVVGLGNGSREAEMMQLNLIFQNQMQLLANPATAMLVTQENIYNTLEDQVKVFDKAAAGRHFTDPKSPQAQQAAMAAQQQQQQMLQMQMQMQAKQQELAERAQRVDELEAQIKQIKVQLDNQNAQTKLELDAAAQVLDEREHRDTHALKERELTAEIQIEKEQKRGADLG